jgi:hypothetical protein
MMPERWKCAVREAPQRCPLQDICLQQRLGLWKPERRYEFNKLFYGDADSWRPTCNRTHSHVNGQATNVLHCYRKL